jgi:hypothetical protein
VTPLGVGLHRSGIASLRVLRHDPASSTPLPPELVKLKDEPTIPLTIKNEQAALAL